MIGERLRLEREARHLTLRGVSEVVGVQPNAQACYEHNRRMPRADYLVRLYAADWDVPFILTGERSPLHETQLAENEQQVLKAFRRLPDTDQRALEQLILSMAALRERVDSEPV
ncbi:helix-turn-helix domain-containing protein [Pseudomonas sp. DSP3-2-2]|uniref:helix-turn-helix domain-containing protein n=1 Tax=unclassified Pseudomonas TaxID=196821 RepID=UPI003CF3316D